MLNDGLFLKKSNDGRNTKTYIWYRTTVELIIILKNWYIMTVDLVMVQNDLKSHFVISYHGF